MNRTDTRTVLLARPGEARGQLQAALEQLGLDLVLVADPLETEQAQVLSLRPNNLVMVMDAGVEAVLERFDDLLALDDCRILFEESELIATRAGWDMARWSRHLSAKLLGHGDVLPAGHEVDMPESPVTAAKVAFEDGILAAAIEKPGVESVFEPVMESTKTRELEALSVTPPQADSSRTMLETTPGIEPVNTLQQAWSSLSATDTIQPSELAVIPDIQSSAAELPIEALGGESDSPFDAFVETPAVPSTQAVSDYNEYDDLDAFSFLDENDIAASIAREAEAAAARKAEAEAEASLRVMDAERDSVFDSAALDALWFQQQDDMSGVSESISVDTAVQQAASDPLMAVEVSHPPAIEDSSVLGGSSFFTEEVFPTTGTSADDGQTFAQDETEEALLQSRSFSSEPAAGSVSFVDDDNGADWSIYQDFDSVSAVPRATLASLPVTTDDAVGDFTSPVDEALSHEAAYQHMEDELSQFEASQLQEDGWHDFERPTPEAQVDSQESEKKPAILLEKAFENVSQWSLSDISLKIDEGGRRPAFDDKRLKDLEQRISSLTLVKTEEEESAEAEAEKAKKNYEGMVLLLGGIGGPDPLRQILQQLPKDFPAPVLIQQKLDSGHYDRLQRQMERVSHLPIILGVSDMTVEAGKVYIVPPGIGLASVGKSQLGFVETQSREFVDLLDILPSASSVAVLLSGATDAFVDSLLRFQQAGGQMLAQSAEGCYDHAMPALMASRGAKIDSPTGIAAQLKALWPMTELK